MPANRVAMGSGANNTARYLGAACGITTFVIVATNVGSGTGAAAVVSGWNAAVAASAGLTLIGALLIAALGVRSRPGR